MVCKITMAVVIPKWGYKQGYIIFSYQDTSFIYKALSITRSLLPGRHKKRPDVKNVGPFFMAPREEKKNLRWFDNRQRRLQLAQLPCGTAAQINNSE